MLKSVDELAPQYMLKIKDQLLCLIEQPLPEVLSRQFQYLYLYLEEISLYPTLLLYCSEPLSFEFNNINLTKKIIFAKNSDFLSTLPQQPNVVNLLFFYLLIQQNSQFEVSSGLWHKIKEIEDQKIRVCGKDTIHLKGIWT